MHARSIFRLFDIAGLGRAAVLGAALTAMGAAAAVADGYIVVIKDHRFDPPVIEVPAGQEIELTVRNADATPEEFESEELDREKMVPAGGEVTIRIGPLDPGSYGYVGEFHEDTAQGRIVAK